MYITEAEMIKSIRKFQLTSSKPYHISPPFNVYVFVLVYVCVFVSPGAIYLNTEAVGHLPVGG